MEGCFRNFHGVGGTLLGFSRGHEHMLNNDYGVGGTFLGIFLGSEAHLENF